MERSIEMADKIIIWVQRKWRKLLLYIFREAIIGYMEGIEGNEPPSVCLDYHIHSPSWAVVHLRSGKTTYMKFVELRHNDIRYIIDFLKQFAISDIDAAPTTKQWFECELYKR